MQIPLLFIPATVADVPALVRLINSAYRGEGSKKGWTTEANLLDGQRTDEENLTELIQKDGNTILTCIDETGTLLGSVFLQKRGPVMYLGMLTVSPELQAKGIGKQLLQAAEHYAIGQQCHSIEMTVISVRQELIAWYNRRGYHSTGVTKPFPIDSKFGVAKQPLEFVVLEKKFTTGLG